MTLLLAAAAISAWLATPLTAQNNRNDREAEAALQAAINREVIDGNLQAAIELYTNLIERHGNSRAVAARALYHLGQAHEKLGNAEARKAYERIARDFADQKDVAADAGRRLAALGGGAIANGDNLRRVSVPANTYVNFSFDGRWMTSTRWGAPGRDKGYNELLVQDTATGETKRLVEGSCGSPCSFSEVGMISPDGKLVAYAWYDDAEIKSHGQLRVIANDVGASPRVLVRKDDLNVDTIAWAPDSQSILVVLRKNDRRDLGWVSVADGAVKIIQSLGSRWVRESGPQISLSPDGRHIVYAALANPPTTTSSSTASADTHIYLLRADGSNEVPLVKSASVNKSPVWTPDGAHVVFTSNLSGRTDLWAVAVRNGKPEGALTLLKRDFGEIEAVGMTKAGTFYFQQTKMGVAQIHIAELTPGGGSRILESFVGFSPTWSPDGKSLAFKRHSTRSQARSNDVVRSVETGQEKAFSRDTTMVPLHWLHDSTRFLTLADTDHEGGVPWWHIVDLTKNTFSRATPGRRGRAMIGAISPDDKTLYTAAGEPSKFNGFDRIIAVDLATGQEREVLRFSGTPELSGGGGVGIALSPDGRSLAVATTNNKKPTEARLFRVDVDGGNYRELHGPYRANHTAFVLVWTKDGRSILFATSVGGRNWNNKSEIMRIGSAGGSPESTGLTIDNLRAFDLSPDGSRIAYSRNPQPLASAPMFYAIDNLPALLSGAK